MLKRGTFRYDPSVVCFSWNCFCSECLPQPRLSHPLSGQWGRTWLGELDEWLQHRSFAVPCLLSSRGGQTARSALVIRVMSCQFQYRVKEERHCRNEMWMRRSPLQKHRRGSESLGSLENWIKSCPPEGVDDSDSRPVFH